jgi:hypothetical protein
LTDDDNEKDTSGLTLAQTVAPLIPKIVLTGFPSFESVNMALRSTSLNGLPPASDFLAKMEGPNAMVDAVERTARQSTSGPDNSDNLNHRGRTPEKKIQLWLIPYFIFVTFPKAVGRFILDIFGRDKATDITATILGYIMILIVVLIVKGLINPDNAWNTFIVAWRIFFPIK